MIFSDNFVPASRENPARTPKQEASEVGAHAPPVDVNTTGNGGGGLPRETAEPEPLPAPSVSDGILDGIGDGLHGVWRDWTTPIWEPASDMYEAYRHGDVIDAFNVVNPLIAVANLSLAIDDGDTYSLTRQSVAIGVTVVVGVIVGKLAEGAASGGKTARGPPEKVSTLKPGPFAKNGIPARSPLKAFIRAERDALNAEGICHTCGTMDPKTKTGDFIPDHQPPSALLKPGETQRLYPHCRDCARIQGGQVTAFKTRKE